VLDLPLGGTELVVPSAAMLNILGVSDSMSDVIAMADAALPVPGASAHLYGKASSRAARKMGHITVVANSDAELRARIKPILSAQPDLPREFIAELCASSPESNKAGKSHQQPLVGIIMGSDSDLPIMLPATKILDRFQVPYELTITSAHRTPQRMVDYARSARSRGLRAIIAGAGGAAHLPGMVASETSLPVVGVPVKASVLDGVDSLYSIVQMPVRRRESHKTLDSSLTMQRGIPTATVGINNSTNAALLACRIIGTSMPHLAVAMEAYAKELEDEVLAKVDTLEQLGWDRYVSDKLKK
jgi:phosphoribosylaminoimidazole carboxylase